MNLKAELRLARKADVDAPKPLRHLLSSLLEALGVDAARRADVVLAVGEALANAVEHAYADADAGGSIEMTANSNDDGSLVVAVVDHGRFIEREGTPGRGYGLKIVRAVAREVNVERSEGTRVAMTFDLGLTAIV